MIDIDILFISSQKMDWIQELEITFMKVKP